jgi:hypothetical protein
MANCIVEVYADTATAHTEIEKIDDSKFLGMAVFVEDGKSKLIVAKKT